MEKKTITLTFDQSGGTENYTRWNCRMKINWVLAFGNGSQTTPNSWQSGNYNRLLIK